MAALSSFGSYRRVELILSGASVGKKSIIRRFVGDNTIALNDYITKSITVDGEEIRLRIADMAAAMKQWRKEEGRRYIRVDGIMLVYDVSDLDSFLDIKDWLFDEIFMYKNFRVHALLLVGNKSGREDERKVSIEMGRQFAEDHDMKFMEVSAKTGHNVELAFKTLVREIIKDVETTQAELRATRATERAGADSMKLVERNIDQQGRVVLDEQTIQILPFLDVEDSLELVKQNIDQQGSVDEWTQQVKLRATRATESVEADGMKHVKRYIAQQGSVDVRSLKAFLIGPSGVGKTTARRRLTKEIDHISSDDIVPSTGVDAPQTVQLYHRTEQSSVIISEQDGGWRSQGLEEQCRTLCSRVLNTSIAPPSSTSSTADQTRSPQQPTTAAAAAAATPAAAATAATPAATVVTLQKPNPLTKFASALKQGWRQLTGSAKDEVTSALTSLVKEEDWETVKEFLEDIEGFTLLNIVDVGGQPECHEILPLLLHGLALNLIFLNVTQDLHSPYTVVYRDESGFSPIQYQSEYTIREIIERVLCSISSLQSSEGHKPTAMLIGTHIDLVTDKHSHMLALDKSIQEAFKDSEFVKNDILYPVNKPEEEKRYIHPLDNVGGDSSDIVELRRLITMIVQSRFPPEKVPITILLLQLILRLRFEDDPGWCSIEECIKIAERCGISKNDLLKENGVLDYLNNRFGTILYDRNVEKLNRRVIVNANIIMTPPTRMFVSAFAANNESPETAKRIRSTGEIPLELMNRACSTSKDGSNKEIPAEEILELLKCRHILYKVRSTKEDKISYFVPFLLYPDHNVVKESSDPKLLASLPYSPLLFLPSIGYVPLGQFSASIVRLALDWTLDELERFRNRIRFCFSRKGERSLHIEFRSLSTHLELRILPTGPEPINPRMILECRSELWKVFCEVASSYPHTRNVKWFYGFYCPHSLKSGGRPHPARCLTDEPQDVLCSQPGCGGVVPLEDKHKCWFTEVHVPVAVTSTPPERGDVVSLFQFNECVASKIPSKWKKVGVALGLSQPQIDAIDGHRRGEPFECFSDVFKYWQSESTSERPANWATLISALRSNTVGEEALAEHIQSILIGDTH